MFEINNAKVVLYSILCGRSISYIMANIRDQPYETLIVLGRGKMYEFISTDGLKYNLPNGLKVFLRTD